MMVVKIAVDKFTMRPVSNIQTPRNCIFYLSSYMHRLFSTSDASSMNLLWPLETAERMVFFKLNIIFPCSDKGSCADCRFCWQVPGGSPK